MLAEMFGDGKKDEEGSGDEPTQAEEVEVEPDESEVDVEPGESVVGTEMDNDLEALVAALNKEGGEDEREAQSEEEDEEEEESEDV